MNMYSLHRRLENTNTSVYALHPGIIDTPILQNFQGISGTYNFGIKVIKMIGKFTYILHVIFFIADGTQKRVKFSGYVSH